MENNTEVFFKAKGSELTKVTFKNNVTIDGEEKALVSANDNYYVVDYINLISDDATMEKLRYVNELDDKMKPLSDAHEKLRLEKQQILEEIATKYKDEVENKDE